MAKYQVLSGFYKSPEWINLRKQPMIQRSSPIKGLVCEHCHEPILRDIDYIGHHIKELTPECHDNIRDPKWVYHMHTPGGKNICQVTIANIPPK